MILRCERLDVPCTIGQYTQGCRGNECREAARRYKARLRGHDPDPYPIVALFDAEPEWRDRAACKGADLDAFFPRHGHIPTEVKELCATCPVKQNCLDFAVKNRIVDGYWGGMSPKQRRRVARA